MSAFHLFVYGTLRARERAAELLHDCRLVGSGTVHGTLYDIAGEFPALMLYGDTAVRGEIWQCQAECLPRLDRYEGTADGLFRRVALNVPGEDGVAVPCWLYVAGPRLARQLTPDRRLARQP